MLEATEKRELRLLRKLAASIEPLIVHRWNPDHDDEPDSFVDVTFQKSSDPDAKAFRKFVRARDAIRALSGTKG